MRIATGLRSFLLISLGCMIHAADGTKKPPGAVLSDLAAPLTLTIPEAGCLVWQKQVYCLVPGKGYRIVVENGRADGLQRVRRWRVFLDGNSEGSGSSNAAAPARKECPVRLDARTEVRLLLEGEVGSFVRCWIEGEALPVAVKTITQPDGRQIMVRTVTMGRPAIREVRLLTFDPDHPDPAVPAPRIEFAVDRATLAIGEAAVLSWRVEGAAQVTLHLPDDIEAPAAGCAQIYPESDMTIKAAALGRGGRAAKEIRLAVAAPEPELAVTIAPRSIDLGQQAVLSWKSRNARMVHFAGPAPCSPLPLSGSMSVSDCGGSGSRSSCPFTIEAECGAHRVSRSVWLEVIDRAALKREQEEEAKREARLRTIDPRDDQAIRARWQEFCRAMAKDDACAAETCLLSKLRESWRKRFAEVRGRFNARNWIALQLYFGQHEGDAAIYVLGPAGAHGGEDFHDEDVVYFMRDAQGSWWLYM